MVPRGFKSRMEGRDLNYQAPILWNQFSVSVHEANTWSSFKTGFKTLLLINLIVGMGLSFLSFPLVMLP